MKKQVSFDKLVQVKEHLHVIDFSNEEKQTYWLTGSEKRSIRKDAKHIVQKISKRQRLSSTISVCTRGLEGYSTQNAQFRREIQKKTKQAVFQEQQRLRTNAFRTTSNTSWYNDDERIATAYKQLSTICQLQARTNALNDQLESFDVMFSSSSSASRIL